MGPQLESDQQKREAGDDIGRPEILPVFMQVAERMRFWELDVAYHREFFAYYFVL